MASSTVAWAVEPVPLHGRQVDVGHEGVVAPVGPQLGLERVGEPGAAHDETDRFARLDLSPPVT